GGGTVGSSELRSDAQGGALCHKMCRGSASVGDGNRAVVFGIGPAAVGDDRRPAGAAGIPIVGVAAEALVEFAVLVQFLAIKLDAEAGLIGHADSAVFVAHEAALNDIVPQVMVVGIGGEGEVGNDGAEM